MCGDRKKYGGKTFPLSSLKADFKSSHAQVVTEKYEEKNMKKMGENFATDIVNSRIIVDGRLQG